MKTTATTWPHAIALLIGVGAVALLLAGCAPVYMPNNVHVPLLKRQGDVRAGAHASTSGVEVQAASALTDHLGLMANFSFARRGSRSDNPRADGEDYHRHRFGEVGIGYFKTWSQGGHAGVYAGYGRGWAESVDAYEFFSSNLVQARGRYTRFFVQPAVGATVDLFQMHMATRLVRINFYEFETGRETAATDQVGVFIEPAVGASLGPDPVRVGVQVGLSVPLTDTDEIAFDYQMAWIALGVRVRLNPWQW